MASTIVKYILDIKTGKARSEVEKTERSVTALNKDLDRTEKEAKKAVRSMQKMETAKKAIGAASKGVLALAAAFTAASVVAFKFSKDIVDATNELNDMANKTGLATSTLQGLNLAFSSSGQEASAAAEGLAQLPAKMSEMATEGSRANKAANRLGISLVDLEGAARSNDDVFRDVVSTIQSIDDPSQRARVAFELLGESAGKLNQAIGAGAEFSNFIDIAQKWGVDTGPEASAAAAEFQQNLALLQMVFAGTRQEVGRTLGTVGDFGDMIIWVGKQLAFLREFLRETDHFFFVLKGTIVETIKDLGGLSAVFSPLLGIINLQLSAIEKVLGIFDRISGTDLSGSLRETVDGLSASLKSAAMEATGLTTAFEAGDRARQEFVKDVETLRLGGTGARPAFDGGGPGGGGSAVETIKDMSDAYAEMDRIIEGTKVLDQFQQLEKAFADNEAKIMEFVDATGDTEKGMEALVAITDQYENAVKDANEELDKLEKSNAARKQAQEFEELANQASKAVAGFSALASGDLAGFATGLIGGPFGAVAGSIISAVSQIGQAGLIDPLTGKPATTERAQELAIESVEERIQNQAKAIEIGLQVLPDLLIEVMPTLLGELALSLTEVLLSLPGLFADALMSRLPNVFDGKDSEGGQTSETTVLKKLVSWVQSIDRGTFASGGRIPFAESGLRFTGDSMGMAVLHPGEFVVPRTGQAPQEVQRDLGARSGGGGITINVSGTIVEQNAVDELVRRIESRFLDFGGGTSPLFGGA